MDSEGNEKNGEMFENIEYMQTNIYANESGTRNN